MPIIREATSEEYQRMLEYVRANYDRGTLYIQLDTETGSMCLAPGLCSNLSYARNPRFNLLKRRR